MSMQLCLFSQRWRERRESYRLAGEPINPRLYEVAELAGDREAKEFILAHHYSSLTPVIPEGMTFVKVQSEDTPIAVWP